MKIKAFFPRADAGTSRSEHRNDENRDPSSTSHVPTIQEEKEDSRRKRLRSSVPTDDVLLDKNINSNVPVVQELSPNSRTDDVNSPLVNASSMKTKQPTSSAVVSECTPDEEDGTIICKTDSLIGSKRDRWQQYSDQIRKNSNKKQPIKNLDRFPVSPSVAAHDDSESESPENRLCVFSKAYYEARVEEISRYRDYVMMKVEAPIEECLDNVRGVLRDGPAISSSDMYRILYGNTSIQSEYTDGHEILEYCRKSPRKANFKETTIPNEFSTAELLLALLLKEFECMIIGEKREDLQNAIRAGPVHLRRYFEQFTKGNWRLLRMDRAEGACNKSMAEDLRKVLSDNLETSTFIEYKDKESLVCMVARLETVLAPLLTSSRIHWTTDGLRLSLWSSHVCCWIKDDHGTSLKVVEDFFCGATRDSIGIKVNGTGPRVFAMASGRLLLGSRRAHFLTRIPSSDTRARDSFVTEDGDCYDVSVHHIMIMVKHGMTRTELDILWKQDEVSTDHITRDLRCNDIFSLRLASRAEQARNQTRYSPQSRFVPLNELSSDTLRDSIKEDNGNNEWFTCKERSIKYTMDVISEACRNGKTLTAPLEPIEGLCYCPQLKCLRKQFSNEQYGYWDISNVKELCFRGNGRTSRYPSHNRTALHKLVGDTIGGQSNATYVQYDEATNEYNIMVHDHVQCPFDPNYLEEVTMRENTIRGIGVETIARVLSKPDSRNFESIIGRTREEAARLIQEHYKKDEFQKDALACRIVNLSVDTLVNWLISGKVTAKYSDYVHTDRESGINKCLPNYVYKIHYCSGRSSICFGPDELANDLIEFWPKKSVHDRYILAAFVDHQSLRQSLYMFLSNGNIRDITHVFGPIMPNLNTKFRMRISKDGEHIEDVVGMRGLANILVDLYHDSSGQTLQERAQAFYGLMRYEVAKWANHHYKTIFYEDLAIEKIFELERDNAEGTRESILCIGPECLLTKAQEYIHPGITSLNMLKQLMNGDGMEEAQERWCECRYDVRGIRTIDRSEWFDKFNTYRKELEDANGMYPPASSKGFGQWTATMRMAYKNDDLSDEQICLLESLDGWKWSGRLNDITSEWLEKFNAYRDELEEKGWRYPPTKSDGMGRWIDTLRMAYKKDELCDEKVRLLESLPGWKWSGPVNGTHFDEWLEKFNAYRDELEETGWRYPPTKSKGLGQWTNTMRMAYKKGGLSDEKVRLLESLPGWKWSGPLNRHLECSGPVNGTHFDEWLEKFNAYRDELEETGWRYPPTKSKGLGQWTNTMRMAYKKGGLSDEKVRLLESLPGWKWSGPLNRHLECSGPVNGRRFDEWLEKFNTYRDELERTGWRYPPTKSKGLGQWTTTMRMAYKKGGLSDEKLTLNRLFLRNIEGFDIGEGRTALG
ncbi:hypothetical protein M9434_002888 [Picochlorum sp. BPE23]|nr:hypothetical protein M9434_002888 [Picochlorum sp. BPE23]